MGNPALGPCVLVYPLGEASHLLLVILGLPSSLSSLPFALTLLIFGLTTALGALLGACAYGLTSTGGGLRAGRGASAP
ncbi:MAG: hypothetical protein ACE5LS_01115 [Thermoplasmata archaeon]